MLKYGTAIKHIAVSGNNRYRVPHIGMTAVIRRPGPGPAGYPCTFGVQRDGFSIITNRAIYFLISD
jgi:hypothetical protein